MKKIYILLLLVGLLGTAFSQTQSSEDESKIDKLRAKATQHFKLNEIVLAKKTFEKLIASPESNSNDVINYALILQETGSYEEAKTWFKKFNELNPTDSRGIAYVNNPNAYSDLLVDKGNFKVKHLDINSPNEDFSAVFYKDKVLFSSSRLRPSPVNRIWKDNSLPFIDIFQAEMQDNFDLKKVKPFDKDMNEKFHDGPISFNSDQTVMYVTKNNYTGKSSEGMVKLKLFKRELIDGEWSEKKSVSFNSEEYSVGHATLTNDNKWMFFSSSIDGGFGNVDIYKVRLYEDGTYGDLINLGSKINSEGKEMFPYINDDILYYSSNGKIGLGGLDVFAVQLIGGQIVGEPINVGVPINSNRDDFSMVMNKENTGGYFSSNRDKGDGSDDIYSFQVLKALEFGKILKGVVTDTEGNLIPNALVNLFDGNGNLLQGVNSDIDGAYSFSVETENNYSLVASKNSYNDGTITANSFGEEREIIANLELTNSKDMWLDISVYDAKTSLIINNVKFQLIDRITGSVFNFTTDSNGSFIDGLENKNINDPGKFDIEFVKPGYLSKTMAYDFIYSNPGAYVIKEMLNPVGAGTNLNKLLSLNPIYFNLDKYDIRPDARVELDKIVKVMNENPNMVVELASHTDCRNSEKYNQRLSQNRAKSTTDYIKSRIPNPANIYGKGYGETNLVNGCACEGEIKSSCSERDHQQNRRTEFTIIKM